MKTGASADYIFALFDCWREWPGGSNDMRIGQVFQQEMPCSCVGVPSSLKAAQHVLTWLGGGDLIVKGNFLSASVPIDVAPTVGMAGLEYDRMRCARSFAIVGQAKMSDFMDIPFSRGPERRPALLREVSWRPHVFLTTNCAFFGRLQFCAWQGHATRMSPGGQKDGIRNR
jgi:hypothetical protein